MSLYGITRPQWFQSLCPSDTIPWHRSWSTLTQVMVWCQQIITWTIVDLSSVRSSDINLWVISQEIPPDFNHWHLLENYRNEISFKSSRGQWVKDKWKIHPLHIDGLVQERCNSIANALELHLSCTNPSICCCCFSAPTKVDTQPCAPCHPSLCRQERPDDLSTSLHNFLLPRWVERSALLIRSIDCPCASAAAFNTLRPRRNGHHFTDYIFKCIFLNENVWISLKISLKFVLKVRINNIPALVRIMAWHRPGDKPLSEPMMVSSLMHICVTLPPWVKNLGQSVTWTWDLMI